MERHHGWTRDLADGSPVALATVTVYLAGTLTSATIYDDTADPPTPKANPFTSDSNGFYFFYAANGRYDVRISGTVPTPYTVGDVLLGSEGMLVTTEALLPSPSSAAQAGRQALVTDGTRGPYVDTGTQWVSVIGRQADVTFFGAKGDGTTDDAAAFQAAIDAVAPYGGTVFFPRRATAYHFASKMDLSGLKSIQLRGAGGPTAGAQAGTLLRFTGTSSDCVVDMTGAVGCLLADLQLVWLSTFTGSAIKNHTNAANNSFERLFLGGVSHTNAAHILSLHDSYSIRVVGVVFGSAQVGIYGRSAGGFANAVQIHDCIFPSFVHLTCSVQNPGQAWVISGCTFEPVVAGGAGALSYTGVEASNGLQYIGNWHGDATATGTWLDFRGDGLNCQANYFGGGGAIDIDLSNYPSRGINIQGNKIGGSAPIGIKLGTTYAQLGVNIIGNVFDDDVTTPIANVRSAGNHSGLVILGNWGPYHASLRPLILAPATQSPWATPDDVNEAIVLTADQCLATLSSDASAISKLVGSSSGDLLLGGNTVLTVGAGGSGAAPPAQPSGYLKVYIDGVGLRQIPYYANA